MRTAFIDQLMKEARKNDKIFLLVGDLGYNVVEPFAREFPNRFKNVGIAEQNMAGVAAGLAMSGFNVYFYSIGNFPMTFAVFVYPFLFYVIKHCTFPPFYVITFV